MDIASHRNINIAVIGCGMMGKERIKAIMALQQKKFPCMCVGIYDPHAKDLETIANTFQVKIFSNIDEILAANPDWVIIATPHDVAVSLAEFFLKHHIKVLIEKPLGRSIKEAELLLNTQQFKNQLYVGFNYRFYDCIQKAYHDLKANYFGQLISISMTLGHGGRPGDETSWKLNKRQCGGGSLLDPGIHLLDLVRLFSSENLQCKSGATWQGFWNTGIEEEVHLILQSQQTIFNLTISNLRWRNTFKIEIHGTDYYGIISGRNRSYGPQTYHRGPRWGWKNAENQAASEELVLTSDGESSFEKELAQLFFNDDKENYLLPCHGEDAYQTMLLWDQCKQQLNLE